VFNFKEVSEMVNLKLVWVVVVGVGFLEEDRSFVFLIFLTQEVNE
jgi:hypothetical protein